LTDTAASSIAQYEAVWASGTDIRVP
jgi:hypothetical protein